MNMIIALPPVLYVLRPEDNQDIAQDIEEYNIYFKNIILPYKEEYDVRVECEYGRNYGEFWRIDTFDCDSFPLTISVYNEYGEKIASKSCVVKVSYKAENPAPFDLLAIGDSMTHGRKYLIHVAHKLKNVNFKGTRSFDGHLYMEGRGGWSYRSFFEQHTICWGGASPMLFPASVEGKDYFGDWDFEMMKKAPDRPTYSYDGLPVFDIKEGQIFHKDEKLWKYENGQGSLFCENPEWELSFSKYMERYEVGHVDAVSLLMGGNDLQIVPYEDSDRVIALFVDNTKKMIESIREYDWNIKIIVNLPIIGAEQYSWGKQLGCFSGSKLYRFNVIKAANALIENLEGVYISATLHNLDPVYGFDSEYYKVNRYADAFVKKQGNWVHPNEVGYHQMGDALAAVIEAVR